MCKYRKLCSQGQVIVIPLHCLIKIPTNESWFRATSQRTFYMHCYANCKSNQDSYTGQGQLDSQHKQGLWFTSATIYGNISIQGF